MFFESARDDKLSEPPPADAYVAALWEYPTLCIAVFGVQFLSPDAQRHLEQLLKARVDLLTPGALNDTLRERISHESVRAA